MPTTKAVKPVRSTTAVHSSTNRSYAGTRQRRRRTKERVSAKRSVTRITGSVRVPRISRRLIRNHINRRNRFVFRFTINDRIIVHRLLDVNGLRRIDWRGSRRRGIYLNGGSSSRGIRRLHGPLTLILHRIQHLIGHPFILQINQIPRAEIVNRAGVLDVVKSDVLTDAGATKLEHIIYAVRQLYRRSLVSEIG